MKAKGKVDTVWFINRLAQRGISQRGLARIMGMDPASAFNLLRGKRRLQLSEAYTLADALAVPSNEVIERFGANMGGYDSGEVPISGYLDETLTVQSQDGLRGKKTAANFGYKGVKVLRAQTAGSEFDCYDGQLFYYLPSKIKGVDPELLGKMCLVHIEKGELKLRVIRKGYTPGKHNLYTAAGKIMEEDCKVLSTLPVILIKF